MTFRHGKSTALFLAHLNATRYFNSGDFADSVATADTTVWGDDDKTFIPGHRDATFSAAGFFDGDIGKVDRTLFTLGNAGQAYPITYCPDGGAVVGRNARLAAGLETEVSNSSPISSAVTLNLSVQTTGGGKFGQVLNGTASLGSATVTGTTVDSGILSGTSNGGIVNIHVPHNNRSTSISVKVQDSTNGTVWVDLAGAAQIVPAGVPVDADHPFGQPTAYQLPVAGTINRYVRALITPTAGTGTFVAVVALARN
jgi:hypothetical protein